MQLSFPSLHQTELCHKSFYRQIFIHIAMKEVHACGCAFCLGALNLTCFLYPFLGRVFLLASKRVSWPCVLLKLAFATEKLAGILGFSWALCIAPNNSTRCECQSIQEELRNASLAHLLNISFLVPINFLLHLHSKTDPCSCHPPIEEHPHGE